MLKFNSTYFSILALLLLSSCIVNRFHVPQDRAAAVVNGTSSLPVAQRNLSLLSWNIGYGGMGQESDFKLDGGQQTRPLSKTLVENNIAAIANFLAASEVDVLLLQEVAKPSFNTYQVNILNEVIRSLPGTSYTFGSDILTRFVPPPFRVAIGNSTFSRRPVKAADTLALPLERTFQYGIFRKGYRMHVLYLEGPIEWVIINIHLSAFDDSSDNVRERQLAETLRFAVSQFEMGKHVIIGGDWNLRLAQSYFSHSTDDRDLFWIRDLDTRKLPDGWNLAVDPTKPTVRTANAPYVEGVNYRLIIDGFLLSPNIDLIDVYTHDLNFANSDHNPVHINVRAH